MQLLNYILFYGTCKQTTSQVMKQRTDTLRQACDKDDPRIKYKPNKNASIEKIYLIDNLFNL